MSAEVASAFVSLIPSFKGGAATIGRELERPTARAGRDVGRKFGESAGTQAAASMGRAIKVGLASAAAGVAALGAVSFFKDAIAGASDLNEAGTKTQAIFGKATSAVNAFAAKGGAALGQTRLDVLDAAATFGTFGKAAGLAGQPLAAFSTNLVGLSTDLASFYNTSPADAVEAIGSALRGEAEPIRKYGVLLDDATLKAEAMRIGLLKPTKDAPKIAAAQARVTLGQKKLRDVIKKNGKTSAEATKAQADLSTAQAALGKATQGTIGNLTQQQKVLAAQSSIYKQTKDAQGDFARTSGGLANQQRILSATFTDLKANIGTKLLPVAVNFVKMLNTKMLPGLQGIYDLVVNGDFTGTLRKAFGWEEDSKPVAFILGVRDAIKDKLIPGIQGLYDLVVKGDFTGALSKAFGWSEDSKAVDFVLGIRDSITNDLIPALQSVPGEVKTAFGKFSTKIDLSGIITSIKDGATEAGGAVIEGIRTGVEKGDWAPLGKSIGTGLHTALANIGSFAKDISKRIGDWAGEVNWVGLGFEFGKQAIPFITGLAFGLVSFDPMDIFRGLSDHWADVLLALLAVAFAPSKLLGPVFKVLDKIPFVGAFLKVSIKWLNDLGGKALKWAGEIIGRFLEGFRGGKGGVLSKIRAGFDRIATPIYVWADDLVKWFGRLPGRFTAWVGDLAHQAGMGIRLFVDDIGRVLRSLWDTYAAPVFRFITKGFALVIAGAVAMLEGLSHVPGFGWAKDAADKLKGVADKANGIAAAIDGIPDAKTITVGIKVNGAGQVTLANGVKVDVGAFKARAAGGPVTKGEPYIVGEKRPELFVPDTSGHIIPRVPSSASSTATGAGTEIHIGQVVAHDYDDFVQQTTRKARQAALREH